MSDRRDRIGSEGTPIEEILGRGSESMPSVARDRIRHNVLSQVGWSAQPIRIHEAFVRAAALFVAVVVGLGSVSYAAASSLPGSPLYPLKRAMEEARIALVVGESRRSEALMDMTRTRAREVERLIDSDASEAVLEEAASHFGEAAHRAVDSEETPARAQQRVNEIEAEVEAAPAPVRERVAEEVPGSPDAQPDPQPEPPQAPQAPSGPADPNGSGAQGSDGSQERSGSSPGPGPGGDGASTDGSTDTGRGSSTNP